MKNVLLVIVLGVHSTAWSATTDWSHVHNLTMKGINRLYSLELDEAMHVFDSVRTLAPGDPRGPFFQSMVHFYRYSLNRDQAELATFFEKSESVISICEDILDRNENDARTKFYLGGIYGYRGLAHQTSNSMLKAAQDGRRGYLLLEEAVIDDPTLYDAQMGFGLFKYLLAKVPRSMKWILSVLGFSGDLEGGLNSIRLAAERGTYTRTEAKLFLAQFLFSEGRRDTAIAYLNELRREYPDNTLFLVLYAFWQHRLNNLDEAMAAATAAVELNKKKKIRYGEELAYSTLGSICFTRNDFSNSAKYYRLYKELGHNDERVPNWTYYRAGLACEIAGDRATAVEFFKRMKEVNDKDRAWDAYYYRRSEELLRRPITEAEILIVKGENEMAQKNYARAVATLTEALARAGNNIDHQARALYGLQQAQFEADSLDVARETSRRLLALTPVNELWIIPHAWYKLGQINAQLGNAAEARKAFMQVRKFDDYDFQGRLEARTEEELKKLKLVN
jgi:tetratricopeptide (TPR) repeat protein